MSLASAAQPRSLRQLARDDRGVIMVVGVFFTFLWIGMIWFLFGIGNAITYRENMQNAADAAAFATAVYNARGMNLIALVNNLMGLVLLTLLGAKLLQVANLVSKGAECHKLEDECSDFDVAACAEAAITCPLNCVEVIGFESKVKTFDTGVHAALQGMHTAETLVAKGWPFIAASKGALGGTAPTFYAYGVTGTETLSWSELPNTVDPNKPTAGKSGSCSSFNGGGTVSDGICATGKDGGPGPRCGLPVASDHYSSVCKVALDDLTAAGGLLPTAITSLSGYGSGLAFSFGAEWFCDNMGFGEDGSLATVENDANAAFTTAGTIAVASAAFGECDVVLPYGMPIGPTPGPPFPQHGSMSLLPQSGPDVKDDCPAWSPMAIYAPATMGLDYYSVWSTAGGSKFANSGLNRDFATNAVQIAALEGTSGSKTVADPPADAQTAVARAEFYYDPYGSPGNVDGLDTVASETTMVAPHYAEKNVLWNMRWRARLRRYHFFPSNISSPLTLVFSEAQAKYDALVAGDTPLLEALAENASSVNPSPPKVDKQDNKPPVGMFH